MSEVSKPGSVLDVVIARRKAYAEAVLAGKVDGQGVDKWRARAEVLAKAYLELVEQLKA